MGVKLRAAAQATCPTSLSDADQDHRGKMTESEILHVGPFAAGVLPVCAFGLTAAVMLPAEQRPPALRTT